MKHLAVAVILAMTLMGCASQVVVTRETMDLKIPELPGFTVEQLRNYI